MSETSFLKEVENSQWISVQQSKSENSIKEYEIEEDSSKREKRLKLYEEWEGRKWKRKMQGRFKQLIMRNKQ
jgi:hypothetical protein